LQQASGAAVSTLLKIMVDVNAPHSTRCTDSMASNSSCNVSADYGCLHSLDSKPSIICGERTIR
jgi:hypothetical protein